LANRLQAKPVKFPGQPFPETPKYPQINVKTLDGGMNTFDDPNDLEDNQFVALQNATVKNKKLSRRVGDSAITPAKPNSLAVKKVYSVKSFDGTLSQFRMTNTTMHKRGVSSWTAITSVGTAAYTVAPNNVVSTDNRHFFSTNGNIVISEINPATNQYDDLGNASKYKYLTAFGDRLVGAYDLSIPSPTTVYWSGNLNFDEWDNSVDPSAGYKPLEESQSDYSDFITGIFGFANQMLVLRERSIWLATKTGSASDPFYFYTATPSIGCDTPSSVQKIPNGVVFYDRRTNCVYVYIIGSPEPVKIGQPVEDSIYSSISDTSAVFSSYDPTEFEYRLCSPLIGTNLTRCWTYSFKSQVWWYEDRENVTCSDSADFNIVSTTIADLAGNIEDLVGTIANLGGSAIPTSELYFGKSDGDILAVDEEIDTGYTTLIQSKVWSAPENNDFFIHRLTFTYEVTSAGEFSIYYSKNPNINSYSDNDPAFTLYKTVTVNQVDANQRVTVNCVKSLRCTQFAWKIQSTDGIFSLIDFKALTEPAGYTR